LRLLEAKRLVLLWAIATDDSGTPPAGDQQRKARALEKNNCRLTQVSELFGRHFTSTGFCNPLGFRKQNRLERRVKGEGTHPT
jgi:hypothetical protein